MDKVKNFLSSDSQYMTSDSKKKIMIIAGAIGGVALFKYLIGGQSGVSQQTTQKLSKPLKEEQFILNVMKDLRGQLFSIWIQVADIYNNVLKENNNNPVLEDGKLIKNVIFDEVQNLYLTKKKMICLKHQIDPDELDIYVDEVYPKNQEIQTLFKDINKNFNESMEGKYPSIDLDQAIFDDVSAEKTLFLVELILRKTGKRFVLVYRDLRQQGEKDFSLKNKKFVDTIRDQRISEMKNQILRENGFSKYQDTPSEILGKLSQNYRQRNLTFAQKLQRLEQQYDVLMDTLTLQENIEQDIVDQIFGSEEIFNNTYQKFLNKN